jgi:hypothetical protein
MGPMLQYAIITLVICNVIMYPFIPFFRTPSRIRSELRDSMHRGEQLKLLKSWGDMRQQNNIKSFIGIIILLVLIIVSFYFTFGYCALYVEAQKSFVMGWIFAVLIDALAIEFAFEFFIACLYYCRSNSCFE